MPSYNETADDLNKKYARSFVLVNKYPCYIEIFDNEEGESDTIFCQYIVDGKKRMTEKLKDLTIEEIYLPNGLFNLPNDWDEALQAWAYKRRPLRQWRRGICHDNSELTNAVSWISQARFGVPIYYVPKLADTKTIKALMEPVYPGDMDQVFASCLKHGDVAISSEFGMMLSPVEPKSFLLFNKNNHLVGKVATTGKIIVHFEPFLQEVQDMVIAKKLGVEVACT